MKRFFKRLGEVWSIIGITLLLFILIEVFFRVYFLFNPVAETRVQADCYQNAGWVEAYYKEFSSCSASRWEPYVYWQRKPFTGTYINVNEQGYRQTITKPHPLSKSNLAIKLFFFGGSSMWGSGVRDTHTLPSLTGNELVKKGFNPDITNFGESGFVSTQEVIKLMAELKQGNIPDVVVFYDGANDIFSSYQSGEAGIPQNEYNREKEFNTLKEKKKSLSVFFLSLRSLATIQFITSRLGSLQSSMPDQAGIDLDLLSDETVRQYNENIRLVNALAKEYGFQAFFYWQPTLFDKSFLTDYEQAELEKAVNLRPFLTAVNDLLFMDDLLYENIRFNNLGTIFQDFREPLYIDWCHVGERGNELIAKRLAEDILPVFDILDITNDPLHE